jgi:hypothetical protein
MTTEGGAELTEFEESCVKSMQRLARKWNSKPNRLWLYSAGGSLFVMLHSGDGNDEPDLRPEIDGVTGCTHGGGLNPNNAVCKIDIENDGGDW